MRPNIKSLILPPYGSADDFIAWIRETYPYIDVVYSEDHDTPIIDGLPEAPYDFRLQDMWDEFVCCNPFIDGSLTEPAASIVHTFEKVNEDDTSNEERFWKASCSESKVGYGLTPEQATLVLMRLLEGRKLWFFRKQPTDFESLSLNRPICEMLAKHGVYTDYHLCSLERWQARNLDHMGKFKGRVLHWHAILNERRDA
jgi:hypothetical protein